MWNVPWSQQLWAFWPYGHYKVLAWNWATSCDCDHCVISQNLVIIWPLISWPIWSVIRWPIWPITHLVDNRLSHLTRDFLIHLTSDLLTHLTSDPLTYLTHDPLIYLTNGPLTHLTHGPLTHWPVTHCQSGSKPFRLPDYSAEITCLGHSMWSSCIWTRYTVAVEFSQSSPPHQSTHWALVGRGFKVVVVAVTHSSV